MAKLQIQDESGKTTTVPLTRDEITVGRKEGNTIRLTERNVSRTHARFLKRGEEIHVEDLSHYGTRVNGERIASSRRVGAGDQIEIGDYVLTLEGVAAVEAPTRLDNSGGAGEQRAPNAKKKAAIEAAARDRIAAAKAEAVAEAGGSGAQKAPHETKPGIPAAKQGRGGGKKRIGANYPTLVAVTTTLAGTEYPLTGETMVMGRAGENDVQVDHHSISRNHAKIVVQDGKVRMVDLQSKNGIRVNGEYWDESILKSGDIVELGKVKFRFVEQGEEFIFRPEDYVEGAVVGAALDEVAPKSGNKAVFLGLALLVLVALAVVYFVVLRQEPKTSNLTGGVTPPVPVAGGQPEQPGAVVGGEQPKADPNAQVVAGADVGAVAGADVAAVAGADVAAVAGADVAAAAGADVAAAAVDRGPEVAAFLAKGKEALEAQRWEEALGAAKEALKLDSENSGAKTLQAQAESEARVGALFGEVQAAQGKGDLAGAWAALQKLGAMPADSVYAARVGELKSAVARALANGEVDKAQKALGAKRWDEAIAAAEAAQAVVPNHAEAADVLAKAQRGKAADARREAELNAKKGNDSEKKDEQAAPKKGGRALYEEAVMIHSSDRKKALGLYEQAASAGYTYAYKMIGSIKLQERDRLGALAAYKKYLATNPKAGDADAVRALISDLSGG